MTTSVVNNLAVIKPSLTDMADAIRILSMEAVHKAKSGHQGMPLGMADVTTVLWTKFLKYDPASPYWPDRDRFVLSAGHGSMLLYALLHLTGYQSISKADIENFRQWGAPTAGHPEYGHVAGVECTTGPLGQGLASAVGMAMAERHLNARFGDDLVDHRTWVIAGDGCLMEGVSHEAISLAGRLKLNKLIVLFDDNNVTIEGAATLVETGDQVARFKAAGWAVKSVDGHDQVKIAAALRWATSQTKPVMIACKTAISRRAAAKEGDRGGHGYNLFDAEIAAARAHMNWSHAPFEVPAQIKKAWETAAKRCAKPRKLWEKTLAASPHAPDFEAAMSGELPLDIFTALDAHIDKSITTKPSEATRSASGLALAQLMPALPQLMGGSADLTGSNNTFVKGMGYFDEPDYAGTYVRYGVREFGMAAAMNGLALHGGIIPYGGTFFVFSDYSRPAIRLSALMGLRTIHVMTHDSIGVGEDGPTHQPVEHLASFRAMPNLLVMRPCDVIETAECWKAALMAKATPSLLVLSRQKTPSLRTQGGNLALKGAYELSPASSDATISLFASGTEVALAVAAQTTLEGLGHPTRVVSTPCWELFDQQDKAYQDQTIGVAPINIAIEAASSLGWERFIGRDGVFIGMSGFGASAPAERLYQEFGITSDAIVTAALSKLADMA
jgi:transketolase